MAPEPVGLGATMRASGTVMFTKADGTKVPADGGISPDYVDVR